MNREIKVRAWDKINNCFFDWKEQYNTLEFNEGIPDRIILYDTEGVLEKDEFETMQYTGLKDKNGITLCEKCHKEFHKTYGYKNNNIKQLKEFLNAIDKNLKTC